MAFDNDRMTMFIIISICFFMTMLQGVQMNQIQIQKLIIIYNYYMQINF